MKPVRSLLATALLAGAGCAVFSPHSRGAEAAEAPSDLRPIPAADLDKIRAALPARAPATPARSRRLLLFVHNVGYGGHPSAEYANHAFTLMGEKTGAYRAVVRRDPEVFRRESLRQFDAVFINNCVGNLFTDPELRQNLV